MTRWRKWNMSSADVLIEFDTPNAGSVTFTALNEDEAGFLEWLGKDAEGSSWFGHERCVQDLSEADYVLSNVSAEWAARRVRRWHHDAALA
jgi:hypothetical protein